MNLRPKNRGAECLAFRFCSFYFAADDGWETLDLPLFAYYLLAPMLCDACHQREALVHLTSTIHVESLGQAPGAQQKQHFCRECADEYFARTPGMNASRGLICLSDWYRSKLYDLLELEHPEAFDYSTTEACERGSEWTRGFLRRNLANAGIDLNEDGFMMLWSDFNCSHHFYTRADEYKRRKG